MPRPERGPDGQMPLMSAIHDGYHCTSGKAGPVISNCTFAGAGEYLNLCYVSNTAKKLSSTISAAVWNVTVQRSSKAIEPSVPSPS